MIKYTHPLSIAALSVFCITAQAANFSYNQLELAVGQTSTDISGTNQTIDGKFADAAISHDLGDVLFVSAEASANNINSGRTYSMGFGGHIPANQQADFVAHIAILNSKVKPYGISQSDSGIVASAGVRFQTNDKLEIDAGISYVSIFDNNTTGLNLGASYKLTNTAAVVIQGTKSDKTTGYAAGIKVYY